MADQADHLVDHVIPHVPVRQWVMSRHHGGSPFGLPRAVTFVILATVLLSLHCDIRALVAFNSDLVVGAEKPLLVGA